MLAVAVTALLSLGQAEIAEFFPLQPGREWTYSDSSMGLSMEYTERTGAPQLVGEHEAVPIMTIIDGKVDGSTFYRYNQDDLVVVAFYQNKPLAKPYPVLRYKGAKSVWDYEGETLFENEPTTLNLKGSCRSAGKKDVLGKMTDCVEAVVEAKVGPYMTSKQTSLYARGIGLVKLKETIKSGKQTIERTKTLTSVKEPEGDQ